MLDRPPVAGADLDSPERCNPADRLSACRLAFLAQPESRRLGSLQIVDLSRLRQRLGNRWPDLRGRVSDVVDATLARSLGPGDLSLKVGEDCRYVLQIGVERRELERHGELLAAEATARLCGTIPGGAAIRVRTMGLDLDAGLDGVNSAETLRTRVAAMGLAPGRDSADAVGKQLERLQPRFRPILNLRKHLVSAYQLAIDRDPAGQRRFRAGAARRMEPEAGRAVRARFARRPRAGAGRGRVVPDARHHALARTIHAAMPRVATAIGRPTDLRGARPAARAAAGAGARADGLPPAVLPRHRRPIAGSRG